MSVKLLINMPEASVPSCTADKIVLPIAEGTLTIIPDRAPELRLLTAGLIRLLDSDNQTFKSWKINGGFADISEDTCRVTTESLEEVTL